MDSYQLFTVGFQLTYLVVFSILLFSGFWSKRLAYIDRSEPFLPYVLHSWWQRFSLAVRGRLRESAAVSVAAWMGSTPLVMIYFKLFSPVALLIGVPIVILLTCIMWLSFLSLSLGMMSTTAAEQVNKVNGSVAEVAKNLASRAADLNYGHYIFSGQPSESVEVLDVKGGGAVYLNIGEGVMLDTGGESTKYDVRNAIRDFDRGVSEIWISHQDGQHYRGIDVLVSENDVRKIRVPDVKHSKPFQDVLINSDCAIELHRLGSRVEGDNYRCEVMYTGFSAAIADDKSIAVMLTWKNKRILFINDIGFYSEKEMLESNFDLKADVLVCGKHIDQQSPSEDFIRAVAPSVVIASNHRFSFQEQRHFSWIQMVKSTGARLFNQSDTGAVSIRVQGESLSFYPIIGEPFFLGQVDR